MGVRRLADLAAFRLAVDFKLEVYRILRASPAADRDLRFRSQLSDAAASVEMNLTEGWSRFNAGEMCTFLRYARASMAEAERHLLDGVARGYYSRTDLTAALDLSGRCGATITNLWKSLQPFTGPNKKGPRAS